MKKIIIVGAGSYIGNYFCNYIKDKNFEVSEIDTKTTKVEQMEFSKADVVLYIAGIAHIPLKKKNKDLYFKINRDLTIAVAKRCKEYGIKQFLFMSSMSIFGDGAVIGKERIITLDTKPSPTDYYGQSKNEAEKELLILNDNNFKVAIVRPPMVYGKNCKGNFPKLYSLIKKLSVFPNIINKRSMIYIGNLCEFFVLLIESENGGIYFPQNREYVNTSQMIKLIAKYCGKKIYFTKLLNLPLRFISVFFKQINKIYGNNIYDLSISEHFDFKYAVYDFEESICDSI